MRCGLVKVVGSSLADDFPIENFHKSLTREMAPTVSRRRMFPIGPALSSSVKVAEEGNTLGCKLHSPIRSHCLKKCPQII